MAFELQLVFSMPRLVLSAFLILLTACSGGGGGSSDATPAPEPEPDEPALEPVELNIRDALPGNNATMANPSLRPVRFAHAGQSDLEFSLQDNCAADDARTTRRAVFDLADAGFDQVLEHYLTCQLTENSNYSLTLEGSRPNGARFTANHVFSTGIVDPGILTVSDHVTRSAAMVNDMFEGYINGALLNDLDVSDSTADLIRDTIVEISEANWDNLTDPDALYAVTARRVTYPSTGPTGAPTIVSGLVAAPVVEETANFTPRERMVVLTHATGSTPGALSVDDAWFILANLFASRGYLVVAPDNYGRGETATNPETYLMASRTAVPAADLLHQVLQDSTYGEVYAGNTATLIGYSQGGHSAIAMWLELQTGGQPSIIVDEVYAGGAPHNLYQTFRGVVRHLDGSCNDDAYCRFVNNDTTVPFATDRILPGFITYTETGLVIEDVISNDTINPAFIMDFLADSPALDDFKLQLQLSSFTDITTYAANLAGADTTVHLYHSDFDRLVPSANTRELADTLAPHVTVDFHEDSCNGAGYEFIFDITDTVGLLHTLCGLSVLDNTLEALK